MRLVWQTELNIERTSPFYFHGKLEYEEQVLKYCFFSPGCDVSELAFSSERGQLLYSTPENLQLLEENRRTYDERKAPMHYVEDDFVFGDYRISHRGVWGYACFNNNEEIWRKTLRGYLYTDMIKNGDNIVFGTAGYGGHFYSLNLESGEILFDFNTGGTSKFFCENESYYFCSKKKKSTEIYRVDFCGNVLDVIEISGIYYDYECPIILRGNRIYVVTLREKGRENYIPVVHCVELK